MYWRHIALVVLQSALLSCGFGKVETQHYDSEIEELASMRKLYKKEGFTVPCLSSATTKSVVEVPPDAKIPDGLTLEKMEPLGCDEDPSEVYEQLIPGGGRYGREVLSI